jgi:hypothetical protein
MTFTIYPGNNHMGEKAFRMCFFEAQMMKGLLKIR